MRRGPQPTTPVRSCSDMRALAALLVLAGAGLAVGAAAGDPGADPAGGDDGSGPRARPGSVAPTTAGRRLDDAGGWILRPQRINRRQWVERVLRRRHVRGLEHGLGRNERE